MAGPGVYDRGPWSLEALEKHLGKGKNEGQIHRHVYLGGQVEAVQEHGPFSFECGCRAWRGAGNDIYLTACSEQHWVLEPEGF